MSAVLHASATKLARLLHSWGARYSLLRPTHRAAGSTNRGISGRLVAIGRAYLGDGRRQLDDRKVQTPARAIRLYEGSLGEWFFGYFGRMVDQPHERLAQVFGELAIELQGQKSTSDTLHSIVEAAPHIVPGTRWAGVSLIHGRKVVAEVPTSNFAAELDEVQSRLNEGPCLTALREHHTVRIDDMRTETRWPAFAREAQQRGVLSLLSFQLFVRAENLGALNLYGDESGAFSEESLIIGEVLAQHAAVAIIGAAAENHLQNALATRDIIGQAKGMLMQRDNLTGIQAFSVLTRASQETNIKLVDAARWLVNEHESGLGHDSAGRDSRRSP